MLSLRTSRLGACSCLVALLPLVACSTSTTTIAPDGDSTAGSAGTSDEGGSGGEDSATGGKSSKGGTSAKGGTSTKSSTARGGSSSAEGGTSAAATGGTTSAAVGGTSATAGGTSALGGTSATLGGTSATLGGTSATVGGTSSIGGAPATGGTTSVATLTVSTTTLPNGSYNHTYSTTLAVSNASAGTLTWTLASGALPSGITLSSNGTISGTPVSSGSFVFAVSVASSSGAIGTATITLEIQRKRWLAFTADTVTAGKGLPYLMDFVADSRPVYDLSSAVGAGCSATNLQFSPDGRYLQFIASSGTNCSTLQLYVVDVRGTTPGTPTRVDTAIAGIQTSCGWSPNSQWLGYHEAYSAGTPNITVVTAGTWTQQASVGGAIGYSTPCVWMGSDRLAWVNDQYYLFHAVHSASGWSQASQARQFGLSSFVGSNANGRAAFAVYDSGTNTTTTLVYDLTTLALSPSYTSTAKVSPDLNLVADGGTLFRSIQGTTLASYQPGANIVWANTSSTVILGPTSSNAMLVDASGTTVTQTTVGSSLGYSKLVFSPSDAKLAFLSASQIAIANRSGTTTSAPIPISSALPSGGSLSTNTVHFSPSSSGLVYLGQQTTAGTTEAYYVNLAGSAPSTPRKVNTVLLSGTTLATVGWTPDSSAVFYVHEGLNLTNVVEAAGTSKKLLTSYKTFAFQP